jgi:Fur family ferric uptake transcriptional regulator
MNSPKNRESFRRLNRKRLIFEILNNQPGLTAHQLQSTAAEEGLTISLVSAYRALRKYRTSGGALENSESRCLQVVSAVLKNCPEGTHLTASEISAQANESDLSIHKATIYRMLARLKVIGYVQTIDKGRKRYYEWKRGGTDHAHLSCIHCGSTIEFEQDYLNEIAEQICSRFQYDFKGIEFTVRSRCPACSAREARIG